MWQSLKTKLLVKQSIFFLGMALGIGLRLFNFGQIPVGTYWDETAILIDATSIATTGRDMHGNHWLQALYPSYGDYKLPVYIWLASIAVKVVGTNELAVRLPSMIVGLATILLAAALAGELAKYWPKQLRQTFQLAAASVVSLSFWAIMFSRIGFEGHLGQLWLGLSFLSLLKTKTKFLWWPIAGIFGALALFTYYSTRFIWPALWLLFIIPVIISIVTDPSKRRQLFLGQIVPAFLSLLIFSGFLLLMLRSPLYPASELFRLSSDSILNQAPFVAQSNLSQLIEGPSGIGRIVLHRYVFQIKALASHVASHLSLDYLFFTGDDNLRHGTGFHGLFPMLFAPVLLIGIIGLFKRHKKVFVFLLFWWLISLLPASVPYDVPHALRSLNSLLPISLFIAFGVTTLYLATTKNIALLFKIISFGVLIESIAFAYYYFTVYPSTSAAEWQSGYQQLAQHAIDHHDAVNQFWINAGDGRIYLWLLAEGVVKPTELSALAWNSYQLDHIENILFTDFVYTYEGFPGTPFALAGRRKEIMSNLAILKATPQLVVPILDKNNQEQFVVTYFNLSKDKLKDVSE